MGRVWCFGLVIVCNGPGLWNSCVFSEGWAAKGMFCKFSKLQLLFTIFPQIFYKSTHPLSSFFLICFFSFLPSSLFLLHCCTNKLETHIIFLLKIPSFLPHSSSLLLLYVRIQFSSSSSRIQNSRSCILLPQRLQWLSEASS